ncbi:hypothetical protein A8C56_21545 [Niabella ginsenosidivorans]|uniref:Uncharacterized protein n=1 Tax=Niabella ginsenosidivorans TaxID=1176587 RepID=A0A1A9I7A0_9BACT|nr:DUF6528 family protein [Niabella ginsenosidivorans]ANH83215.1 hypothetical protein A8C56_21545 [Niabella ginsenosidivorans]
MKGFLLFFTAFLFLHCSAQQLQKVPEKFWVVCGDDKAMIIDPSKTVNGAPGIVWQWENSEAKILPPIYQKLLRPLDDCKPVDDGKMLLLTSSGGATLLVDVATKAVRFYARTPMAHSAALLPGGYIAVANSTHPGGNSIEIYHRDHPEKVICKDSLYSGHGVLWNKKRKLLYVLGFDELRAYNLHIRGEDARLVKVKTWKLPAPGGHDLSGVDEDQLLVSAHGHVWDFRINEGRFTPFQLLAEIPDVKSVNYNSTTKQLVYTKAEESWWTFNIYSRNPDKKLHIPGTKLYKVRVAGWGR